MGNRIPEEVVEQIRTSSDIVEVIGEYVQLRKQGRNYFGLCPFHGENSPSFSVSSDKQIFHCFGCGEGGNVFSFLMKMEGLAFTEAVQKLGERNPTIGPETTLGRHIEHAQYVSVGERALGSPHGARQIAHETLAVAQARMRRRQAYGRGTGVATCVMRRGDGRVP